MSSFFSLTLISSLIIFLSFTSTPQGFSTQGFSNEKAQVFAQAFQNTKQKKEKINLQNHPHQKKILKESTELLNLKASIQKDIQHYFPKNKDSLLKSASNLKKPKNCLTVSPEENLQALLSQLPPHHSVCLSEGVYPGNLTIDRPLTLWGTPYSILRSKGQGTNLRILSNQVKVVGFTIYKSGSRYDLQDAGLYVKGNHVRVEGLNVFRATYGIIVEQSNHVSIFKNKILGDPSSTLGLRGDAIRLWETRHSLIQENQIVNSRDMIIWYSYDNQIIKNTVKNGRYGTHFMYSHRNFIFKNRYLKNIIGIFIMYSRYNTFKENTLAEAHGTSGYGLGMKESGQLQFIENKIYKNTVGIYLDHSPYDPRFKNLFSGNLIQMNSTAITFHSSPRWNRFQKNSFINNLNLVHVYGGGNATKIKWEKNYFDTYKGYDLNKDGIGDRPFELKKLSEDLMGKYPTITFFRGTLSLLLIDIVGKVIPLFSPQLLLKDPRPSMKKNPEKIWK